MADTAAGAAVYSTAGAVFVLLVTLCGFLLPMVLVYPPVPPRESDFLRETHSRLGLEPARSNLRSQFSRGRHAAQAGRRARIHSLWLYPVKSCRGIEVERAKVLPAGLEFDRLFTFAQLRSPFPVGAGSAADEQPPQSPPRDRWEFITQRQFPRLATVDVELWQPDVAKARRSGFRVAGSFLVVRFPWRDDGLRGRLAWAAAKLARGLAAQPEKEMVLPVEFPSQADIDAKGFAYEDVTVWRDSVSALNVEAELPPELRLYLGVSNRLGLFRVDPARLREIYRCAPTQAEAGYQPVTGFQDAYPLHLLNLASVQDLDSKIAKDKDLQQLDARRFRSNIIITGAPAYDEDSWKTIRLRPAEPFSGGGSDPKFHVSCRTVRCKLPNVDQDTGTRHPVEPDRTLRAHRDIDDGAPNMGCLGMQLTPLFDRTDRPEHMEITLDLGMSVDVLERGPHKYVRI